MTVATRKRRGRDSERILAEYLRPLWPHATANAPGASGPDVLHTPGVALEVKARRGLDLPAWLRQARRNAGHGLPILVIRGDGQGPASVGEWAAVVRLDTLLEVLAPDDEPCPTITRRHPPAF